MRKIDFKPKENVDEYLDTDFNYKIYEELTENDEWKGVFEPLDFFNIFYENLALISNNIDNPQGFIEYLKGQKFHIKKYLFLIENLRDELFRVLHHMPENDEVWNFCKYIDSECNEIFAILYPEKQKELEIETLKRREAFDRDINDYLAKFTSFEDLEKDLELIDDIQEKIKILIKHKARFLKEKKDFSLDERFGEKCQIEIDMLKELAEIDSQPSEPIDFKNNFDRVAEYDVYNHFKKLVEKKMLTDAELNEYLILAFQEKKTPKKPFKLKREHSTKAYVRKIFYTYFKNEAQSPHGIKDDYVKLLTDYFEGYSFKTTKSNFSK